MPEHHFPVESSVLSAAALAERVLSRYPLPAPVRCRLASRGVNGVEAGEATYFLRVSPHGWRTEAELRAEVALIDDLHRRGVRVARSLPRADGAPLTCLLAPEGERYAVLFAAAAGADVRDIDRGQSRAFGRLAAAFHDAVDAAPAVDPRPAIDERLLLDEPLAAIRALDVDRGEDLAFLETIAERVRRRLADLPRVSPAHGLCHGDLHWGNVRFDADGAPTLFDFDFCGHGWRVYDLTVFLWNAFGERRPKRWRDERWRAFLRGYREVRPLDREWLAAVPLFLVARQVWLIGLDATGRGEWLPQWLTPRWFREMVAPIRGWVVEHPILAP